MLNMLLELTNGSFFYKMKMFQDIIANSEEVLMEIDISDCVEFGTYNGQELLIYDMKDGWKHIKYSCCITQMFNRIVIQNVWSDKGKEFEYDFNTTWDKLEKKYMK